MGEQRCACKCAGARLYPYADDIETHRRGEARFSALGSAYASRTSGRSRGSRAGSGLPCLGLGELHHRRSPTGRWRLDRLWRGRRCRDRITGVDVSARLAIEPEVSSMRKVIVTCAITGSVHTPSMSPYLPVTPEEIAASAIEAAAAGASVVHLHARDPLIGKPTQDPDVYRRFLPQIVSASDVVVNITTGGSPILA